MTGVWPGSLPMTSPQPEFPIVGVFFSIPGLTMIVFRKQCSMARVRWNNRLWKTRLPDNQYETGFVVAGLITLVVGILISLGII